MKAVSKALLGLTFAVVALFTAIPQIPLFAQTALYTTTLSATLAAPAQGSPAQYIQLTSGSNVAVGQGGVIDGEYVTFIASTPSTTRWQIQRGQSGTTAAAHSSGAAVLFGATNNFAFNSAQPSGACVSTAQPASPYVVVSLSVDIFMCPAVSTLTGSTAASWGQVVADGQPYPNGTRYTGWTYTTAGALTIQPGMQQIGSAGALAMTLAAPAAWQNGMVMTLLASTAQAHTVTYTAGFYGTTTSSDVATYGGAIGDSLTIYAVNGAWRILTMKGVTVG